MSIDRLSVYRDHPHWLPEKPRAYPWDNEEFQTKFILQLSNQLGAITSSNKTIDQLFYLLNPFLEKDFFISPYSIDLINNIQNILQYSRITYASMILLDAENLSVDNRLEKILEENSHDSLGVMVINLAYASQEPSISRL